MIFLEIIFQSFYCFIQSIRIGFLCSFRRLIYYITAFSFCQVLFSTFFKISVFALVKRLDYYITENLNLSIWQFTQTIKKNSVIIYVFSTALVSPKKSIFKKKVKKFSVFLQNPLFKQVFLCYNILINYIGGTLYYV